MPTFTFTSPEGKKYDVTGPEGATKEQAFGILQQQLGAGTAKATPASPLDRLPPETSPGNQPGPKNADSIINRILGIGEAGLSAATGAAGTTAGQLYGIGKTLTGGKYGTQAGIQQGEKAGTELAEKLTYQPRTQTGQNITEALGKSEGLRALQGLPVEGPMLARLPEVPRTAARGLEAGGVAAQQGVQRAGQAAARGVAGALPEVDAETRRLGQIAHTMGMRLQPHQIYGSERGPGKYVKRAGTLVGDIPFAGGQEDRNFSIVQQRLADLGGVEGPAITKSTFAPAVDRAGGTIGEVTQKYDIPVTPAFISQLRSNGARQLPEVAKVINDYADDLEKLAVGTRTLPGGGRTGGTRTLRGTEFRKLNTELADQIRGTDKADLKRSLRGLQDDLQQAFRKNMTAEDAARYDKARKQYAILMTLEPLVAKSQGEINPQLLLGSINRTPAGRSAMARGAAGELGDLADISQRFLKAPTSSGTPEMQLVQKALAGLGAAGTAAGAAAAPTIALPAILGTVGAGRLYNRALGPAISEGVLQRPPSP